MSTQTQLYICFGLMLTVIVVFGVLIAMEVMG
jgi:hypothetical protein